MGVICTSLAFPPALEAVVAGAKGDAIYFIYFFYPFDLFFHVGTERFLYKSGIRALMFSPPPLPPPHPPPPAPPSPPPPPRGELAGLSCPL